MSKYINRHTHRSYDFFSFEECEFAGLTNSQSPQSPYFKGLGLTRSVLKLAAYYYIAV